MMAKRKPWLEELRMNMKLVAKVIGLGALGMGLMYGDTIGNPVIERTYYDTCVGCSFVLATPFAPNSGTLTTWSFYADTTGGSITPILYTQTPGGDFVIAGIGTTRTVTSLGVNTYAFGLTAGVNAVTGSNFYFGYRDGGASFGSGNGGTVSFTHTSAGTLMIYFGNGLPGGPENVGIAVGQTMVQGTLGLGGTGLQNTGYSLSATATGGAAPPVATPTLSPFAAILLAAGLCVAAMYLMRKRMAGFDTKS